MYTSIYLDKLPDLIGELAKAPEMKRIADIGMYCGCDYTNFLLYQKLDTRYSRLIHSIGVAGIVYNFTSDIKQSVAGLFHDISTPAFAHTIDFMNNDHLTQQSTEADTASFIKGSRQIMELLTKHDIDIDEVSDYHRYPIADNDTPMLSADRLEYTIGTAYDLYKTDLSEIREVYQDLSVFENEHGQVEIGFNTLDCARGFFKLSMRNSRLFVSDEDRFSMQYLADIVRQAINLGVLKASDLYTTEGDVIAKLKADSNTNCLWEDYTSLSSVSTVSEQDLTRYCVNVTAKKRYIDPLVKTGGKVVRLSVADTGVAGQISEFLGLEFDRWLVAGR